MSINKEDIDVTEKAVELLEENGFEVESVDRVFGFEEVGHDSEKEEFEDIGRVSKVELAIRKEHY